MKALRSGLRKTSLASVLRSPSLCLQSRTSTPLIPTDAHLPGPLSVYTCPLGSVINSIPLSLRRTPVQKNILQSPHLFLTASLGLEEVVTADVLKSTDGEERIYYKPLVPHVDLENTCRIDPSVFTPPSTCQTAQPERMSEDCS